MTGNPVNESSWVNAEDFEARFPGFLVDIQTWGQVSVQGGKYVTSIQIRSKIWVFYFHFLLSILCWNVVVSFGGKNGYKMFSLKQNSGFKDFC